MYEQLFLMYVIPSVMVQSYICYVTKPIVEVELSKFGDFSFCVEGGGEGHGAKNPGGFLTAQTQLT